MRYLSPEGGCVLVGIVIHRVVRSIVLDVGYALIRRLDFGRGELRPSIIEDGDPLLDSGEGLADLELKRLEQTECVIVGSGPDLLRLRPSAIDDFEALDLGTLEQTALADQEGRLLLGAADDTARLVFGLLDDPLALRVDPLGRTNFLRDRDAQLIDQVQDSVPINDRVARQRQRLATGDQRFEPLEEEDDVQVMVSDRAGQGRLSHAPRPLIAGQRGGNGRDRSGRHHSGHVSAK